MKNLENAHLLLRLARKDLRAAWILANSEEMEAEAVGFHIQQAAEKVLKMWLEILGANYPKTHDLSLLLGLLEDRGEDVERLWSLVELIPFAVEFRYSIFEEDFFDWEDMYNLVANLANRIEERLTQKETE